MNLSKEIGEKQFLVFGSRGGQISPLMHILPCKQIEHRSGQTKGLPWSGSYLFDTQTVLLKEFLKKIDFEKKNQQTAKKKTWKISQSAKS